MDTKNTCCEFFTGGGQSDVRKSMQPSAVKLYGARHMQGRNGNALGTFVLLGRRV